MHHRRIAVFAILCFAPVAALAQVSPYAGQDAREIKALSAQDVDDLLKGRGMGLAKAAELNGYPGPAHALDMAAALGLDAAQVAALQDIKARMTAESQRIGIDIVERERTLDRLFAESRIDPPALAQATGEIGVLQGRLRNAHLAAHLETRAVLTDAQVRRYETLRGYRKPADAGMTGGGEMPAGQGHGHGGHPGGTMHQGG